MDDNGAHETSGAVPTLLLAYVRARAGDDAVDEVARRAGLDVADGKPPRWISYAATVRLYDAVADVLDDPDAVHRAAAEALTVSHDHALVLVLRRIGSPRRVLRALPLVASRFTRVNTFRVTGLTRRSAEVEYALADGYEHSRHDCALTRGLLACVPVVFGGPPALVREVRCQGDGHASCRFSVVYQNVGPWRRRGRRGAAAEIATLREQVVQLGNAAADLAGSEDVVDAVERIVDRAAAAVLAPAHLLVLTDDEGRPGVVRHRGLDEETAERLAPEVAAGEVRARENVTLVDVASTRRTHGRLAVLHDDHLGPTPDEVALLHAYGRHAAAALDLLIALEESREREARTQALLALAQSLAGAQDEHAVADVLVAATREIAGCDSASVFLWEPSRGELRRLVSSGITPDALEGEVGRPLRVDDVPELGPLLARREPIRLEPTTASARVRGVMDAIGSGVTMAIPLVGEDAFLGLVTANWASAAAADDVAATRAEAVTSQGATALERVRLIDTVRHQAQHDTLSGLPNRALFTRVLAERLRANGPEDGVAVLFCDIDRFKAVNDELGHAAGDELLRQVAARLRGICRPTDVLGRLSGDEFALVVQHVDEQAAVAVAQRAIEAIEPPFRIDGREVRVTVSIGVAVHEGPDGWGDRLLAAADDGMHVAKARGRNQIAVAGVVADRMVVPSLEAELGRAVDAGQLRLYFQPLVDVTQPGGPVVVGAEALLRWAHPRLGLLAPGAFLPLAEEAQLVTELDLWAIDAACEALSQWQPPEGGEPLVVAVNLAGSTLVDPRLAGAVREALRAHDLDPSRLHLEVIESRSLVDLPGVIEHLAELRQMGVRIALDDFGTGYSTLAWLQALPVDQVKIDRSFVKRLPDDAASLAVVRGVIALAAEIGLQVVAEGVETGDQLEALRSAGCRWVQGYLLGRPAPILDVALAVASREQAEQD